MTHLLMTRLPLFRQTLLAVVGLTLGLAGHSLHAQTSSPPRPSADPVQITFDYTYLRANARPGQCGCFNLSGGGAEGAFHLWRSFSAVAAVTATTTEDSNVPGRSISLAFVTAGPRFTYRNPRWRRYAPFVEGLAGAVHGFDAPFPAKNGEIHGAADAVALFVGGGLDIALSQHLAIRPVHADYGYTQLPNGVNDHQNLFRYSAGIVLRIR